MTVWAQACPLFVHLVEEDLADSPEAELLVRHYLRDLLMGSGSAGNGMDAKVDTLILGCTHYPVLAPVLAKVLGPEIRLVESASVAAEWVSDVGRCRRTWAPAGSRIS